MTDKIKKGSKVIVVGGPNEGDEGTVLEVWRGYDPDTKTTGNRIRIEVSEDPETARMRTIADTDKTVIVTRLSYVRELR